MIGLAAGSGPRGLVPVVGLAGIVAGAPSQCESAWIMSLLPIRVKRA